MVNTGVVADSYDRYCGYHEGGVSYSRAKYGIVHFSVGATHTPAKHRRNHTKLASTIDNSSTHPELQLWFPNAPLSPLFFFAVPRFTIGMIPVVT